MRKRSLGHLSVSDIEAVDPNLSHGHVFVCGPPVLDNLRKGLATRGVPPYRIHSETFDFRWRGRAPSGGRAAMSLVLTAQPTQGEPHRGAIRGSMLSGSGLI